MKNKVESKIGHIIIHKGTPQLRAETHSGQFPHIWPSKCKVEALSAGTPPKWADWQILLRSYTWTGSLELAPVDCSGKKVYNCDRRSAEKGDNDWASSFCLHTISGDVRSAIAIVPSCTEY